MKYSIKIICYIICSFLLHNTTTLCMKKQKSKTTGRNQPPLPQISPIFSTSTLDQKFTSITDSLGHAYVYENINRTTRNLIYKNTSGTTIANGFLPNNKTLILLQSNNNIPKAKSGQEYYFFLFDLHQMKEILAKKYDTLMQKYLLSNCGQYIAFLFTNKMVEIFDLNNGERITQKEIQDPPLSFSVSYDKKITVFVYTKKIIIIEKAKTSDSIQEKVFHSPIQTCNFYSRSNTFLIVTFNKAIQVLKKESSTQHNTEYKEWYSKKYNNTIKHILLFQDQFLQILFEDNHIHIIDLQQKTPKQIFNKKIDTTQASVIWRIVKNFIIFQNQDRTFKIFNRTNNQEQTSIHKITDFLIDKNKQYLYVKCTNNTYHILDLENGQLIHTGIEHEPIDSFHINADKTLIALTIYKNYIKVIYQPNNDRTEKYNLKHFGTIIETDLSKKKNFLIVENTNKKITIIQLVGEQNKLITKSLLRKTFNKNIKKKYLNKQERFLTVELENNHIEIFDMEKQNACIFKNKINAPIKDIQVNEEKTYSLITFADKTFTLFNIAEQKSILNNTITQDIIYWEIQPQHNLTLIGKDNSIQVFNLKDQTWQTFFNTFDDSSLIQRWGINRKNEFIRIDLTSPSSVAEIITICNLLKKGKQVFQKQFDQKVESWRISTDNRFAELDFADKIRIFELEQENNPEVASFEKKGSLIRKTGHKRKLEEKTPNEYEKKKKKRKLHLEGL